MKTKTLLIIALLINLKLSAQSNIISVNEKVQHPRFITTKTGEQIMVFDDFYSLMTKEQKADWKHYYDSCASATNAALADVRAKDFSPLPLPNAQPNNYKIKTLRADSIFYRKKINLMRMEDEKRK